MKYSVVIGGLLMGALAACNDPSSASAVKPDAIASAAQPTTVSPASVLVSSEPVSTEDAVVLNEHCNIEGIDGRLFEAAALNVDRAGTHEISGWIVNAPAGAIPKNLKLVVNGVGETAGVWTSEAVTMIERKGVAETRGYPAELVNSGFSFKVDTNTLPAGRYHVYAIAADDKGSVICDPGRQIDLQG